MKSKDLTGVSNTFFVILNAVKNLFGLLDVIAVLSLPFFLLGAQKKEPKKSAVLQPA
ncbi:MAG TPA: hypothetical protein VEY71_09180 [Chitinophagales bacterium]|nr:hypothetical protein [Chitinophagales bacterium]